MEKLLEEFSLGLFFWQTILFGLLVFLLRKFAWKPIFKAVNDREKGIKNALEAAEAAKKEMQNITADSEKQLKEARAERDALLKEARELKDTIIAEAKEQAKVEGDTLIQQAQAAIASEKKAAIADLKTQVADLALEIAEKVIKEKLSDTQKQIELVERMVDDIKLN